MTDQADQHRVLACTTRPVDHDSGAPELDKLYLRSVPPAVPAMAHRGKKKPENITPCESLRGQLENVLI